MKYSNATVAGCSVVFAAFVIAVASALTSPFDEPDTIRAVCREAVLAAVPGVKRWSYFEQGVPRWPVKAHAYGWRVIVEYQGGSKVCNVTAGASGRLRAVLTD